ncbi:MAG TPA: molybdenum cofactor guanylyltransferase [Candidatus Saccharimonadales bacterium]|nr:molybdenum cofactor guanylyltransferase [Candidatus Saccharimonadales bacterium]
MIPGPNKGEICILAGGLSARMGRDKGGLRWRGKSLLQHVRGAARKGHWPARVIRRDIVPRCGPLGGVYTALKTTRYDAVLFLACDMPFITGELIGRFLKLKGPAFAHGAEGAGFPFLLPRTALSLVEEQLAARRYSLHSLAKRCHARKVQGSKGTHELFNVNTPQDWKLAREIQSKPCHSAQKR